MRYEPLEGAEQRCPVCKKIFYSTPVHAYKIQVKNVKKKVCSYSCVRKWEKENDD